MSFQALQHRYFLSTMFVAFGTLGFCIAQMAANWMDYEAGYVGLWTDCVYPNDTAEAYCMYEIPIDCDETALTGPDWMETIRSMGCLCLAMYVYMMFAGIQAGRDPPPTTLLTHLKARMMLFTHFVIGTMMLTSSILYFHNYKGHYTDEGKGQDLRPGLGLVAALVGGSLLVINASYLSYHHDTGFTAFLKQKLNSGNGSTSNSSSQRGVKSRFARLLLVLTPCRRKPHNTNSDNSNNNGNSTNVPTQRTPIGNVTQHPRNSAASAHTVLTVVTLSDENTITPTSNSTPTQNTITDQNSPPTNVFVIGQGNDSDILSPAAQSRAGSVASTGRLNVEVRPIPPPASAADRDNATNVDGGTQPSQNAANGNTAIASSLPTPIVLDYSQYMLDDESQPPPSYEDAIKAESNGRVQ